MTKPYALVIEDDFDAATIISEALKAANYKVSVIHDGEMASTQLAAQIPDFIALDLHLPGKDGEMLLKQIRKDDRLKSCRIVLVTADARLAKQLEASADLVLLKPISFTQLQHLARRLMPDK